MDVNPVVVSVIVVPPSSTAETVDAPATVNELVSGLVVVSTASLNVRIIVLSAVLSAVNVGATESSADTLPPLAGAFVPETDWSTTSPDAAT